MKLVWKISLLPFGIVVSIAITSLISQSALVQKSSIFRNIEENIAPLYYEIGRLELITTYQRASFSEAGVTGDLERLQKANALTDSALLKISVVDSLSDIFHPIDDSLNTIYRKYSNASSEFVNKMILGEVDIDPTEMNLLYNRIRFILTERQEFIDKLFSTQQELIYSSSRLISRLMIMILSISICALIAFLLLGKALSRALCHISRQIYSISKGDYSNRLPAVKDAELNTIVSAFNEMSQEIERTLSELAQREEYISKLLKNSNDIFQIMTADGVPIYISDSISDILGYTPEERIGKSALADIHPDDAPFVLEVLKRLITYPDDSVHVEYRYMHKSGYWVFLETVASNFLDDSVIQGIVLNVRDVSERKNTEMELARSNQILKTLLDNLPSGVFMADATTGAPILANSKAKELLGYGIIQDATKENLSTVYQAHRIGQDGPYPIEEMPIVRGMNGESSYIDDLVVIRPDGVEILLEIYGTPVNDENGVVWASIVNFQDITKRLEAQKDRDLLMEKLHQSQKMEAVGQLAGGVAHDFNNVLAGIMGAVELLSDDENLTPDQREYADIILKATERAGGLTKKLLTFSRRGVRVSSAVNCLHIIQDTVLLLRHTIDKKIDIKVENRAIQTSVIGDDSVLQNVFMNLGINASHAMPDGGEITFTLENLELDEEYCEVSSFDITPGDYLEILIRDNGCGMSPDIQNRIFEPFFSTKEAGKGTGLGLASVYGAVQEHNGVITVYSEQEKGTVFHIYLPVTGEAVKRDIEYSAPVSSSNKMILVVDDEELIRITATAILRNLGYRVICAENGEEAVKTFSEIYGEVDLIILDMIMPVMGGREAFAKLREIRSDIPIIIASGFAKEEDMTVLKRGGVSGFLNKPFRKADMGDMIGGLLGG